MKTRRRPVKSAAKVGPVMHAVKTTTGAVANFVTEWPLHLTTLVLVVAVAVLAPNQVGLLVYKAALITLPTVIVYWIARWILHYDVNQLDNGDLNPTEKTLLVYLICAAMLAAGLAA